MSGRRIEKKALPTTGNLKPYEDNFFDRCFTRPLLLVSIRNDPEDKKRIHADPENHFHWQVIDPENGISYEAPFDPASEIVAAHKRRTDLSSVPEHYEIVGQNYPAKYYFNAERISDRFVFRIWRYHPIPKQEPQGLYESFRLVFYKAGCWMEGRDGRMTPFVPGMLYSKKSVLKKAIEFPGLRQYAWKSTFNKREMTDFAKDLINNCNVDNMSKIIYCQGFLNVTVKSFLSFYMMSLRKQHFNTNVPEWIKQDLEKRTSTEKVNGFLAIICRDQAAYIGKDKMFLFKKNVITEKWSSSNRLYCWEIMASSMNELGIDGRSYRKAFRGTMFEECLYVKKTRPYDAGVLELFDFEKKYLAGEQAAKMRRYDILVNMLFYTYNCAHNSLARKAPLPNTLMITGPQIKFLEVPDRNISMFDYYKIIQDPFYAKTFPDIETRLKYILMSKAQLWRIVEALGEKDAIPYFRALGKYKIEERERLVQEYTDYLSSQRHYASMYVRNHPEEGIRDFPIKVKPSRIRDIHREATRIAGLWHEEERIRYDTQWKMEIKQQEKEIQSQKILLKDMEYEDEQYALSLPSTRQDIISEGTSLHHCVGSYASQVANGITTILFLRKKSCPKAPYLTVEIKNRRITQCFGCHDSFNTDEKARIFLENYAQKKGYKIKCRI